MATAIQYRRGTTAQHSSFTGLEGEITVDTDLKTVRVHDGLTAGGIRLAKYDELGAASAGDITAVIAGSGLTGGSTTGDATISLDYENLTGNLVPSANNTYSLGSLTNVWKDVYVGPGSLYVNGQKVLEDNSGTIQFSADTNQNISIVTTGSGDLELTAGGTIQLKSDTTLSAGKTISSSGGVTFGSNLNINSNNINNLDDPIEAQDAATKAYVDSTSYLTGSDGVSVSAGVLTADSTVVRTTGAQTIAGAKTYSDDAVFNGNVTISGTQTTVNSQITSLADSIIELNRDASGNPTEDAGISVNRGSAADVALIWDESEGYWAFTNDGTNYTEIGSGGGIALTDISVGAENPADGDGAIAYDNTTGVFTYTPPATTTSFTALTTFGSTTEIATTLTGATGVVTHDITSRSLFIHSSVAADFTANFTNVPTTDDRTLSVALIISQGATGYLPTAVQIDGAAQTILWQGASTPTSTPSATDIASFTFIRSAGAWTVLGTVTAFGSV